MVSSSKKKRGKQRRAAKDKAMLHDAITDVANGNECQVITPKVYLELVKQANNHAIQALAAPEVDVDILKSGLPYALDFLKRCEDETFDEVRLDVGGGDLITPVTWIEVLIRAEIKEESCRLQIAQNIGPLVSCMCNDTRRLFFKSKKHWNEGIQAFAALIHNILCNYENLRSKDIIGTLLQYEVLLTSIIQWAFWDKEYRPDITNEVKANDCAKINELGISTVNRLIKAADTQTEEVRERLKTIGTTPIISKEYDPECSISFMIGLIRQIKIKDWTIDTSIALQRLVANMGCVDKVVITELIDLGINTSDDRWVVHVAVVLDFMILSEHSNGRFYSNDTRVAFAVRCGLTELCLTFIDRFGSKESFGKEKDNTSSPFASILSILSNIYWVGLHKKTAKAIRHKKCSIEQELARLEKNTNITNNVKCNELLDIVKATIDLNGSYCCRCNKSLSRTEVKLCNGCGCMTYCSRACQKEDWQNGHKLACCKTYTIEKVGQYQGKLSPKKTPKDERKASKLKELEVNMNMIQLKLFLDHKETILSQVKTLGVPIYDCVVRFDLDDCPLEVTTHEYNDVDDYKLKRGFEESRSKENITCIYNCFIYDGTLAEGELRTPCLQMQRLFPHGWLSTNETHK